MKVIQFLILVFFLFFLACREDAPVRESKNSLKDTVKQKKISEKSYKNINKIKNHNRYNIVDYFILLQENKLIDVPCNLFETDKVWKCVSEKDEAGFVNEYETVVDKKNGYIKIEDRGTGAGVLVTEVALFKTEEKNDIIAVNKYFADGLLQTSSKPLQFYSYKNSKFQSEKKIFPKTNPNDFFKKPVVEKNEQIGIYFKLPHYETVVKYCLDSFYVAKRENSFKDNIKTYELTFRFDKKQCKFLKEE